jgi:hypothetical protein
MPNFIYHYYKTLRRYILVFTGYLTSLRIIYYQLEPQGLYIAASRARIRASN